MLGLLALVQIALHALPVVEYEQHLSAGGKIMT
jgi:hypothetical protein